MRNTSAEATPGARPAAPVAQVVPPQVGENVPAPHNPTPFCADWPGNAVAGGAMMVVGAL